MAEAIADPEFQAEMEAIPPGAVMDAVSDPSLGGSMRLYMGRVLLDRGDLQRETRLRLLGQQYNATIVYNPTWAKAWLQEGVALLPPSHDAANVVASLEAMGWLLDAEGKKRMVRLILAGDR